MELWEINFEQRMVLPFSDLAAAVLEEDAFAFRAKSPSDMLCRIFNNHYLNCDASIGRRLNQQREELDNVLQTCPDRAQAVALLCHSRSKELLSRVYWERGNHKIPIRLQNGTYEKLKACYKLEGAYYSRPSLYMKAVVEDYCRRMPVQRERIYFADRFECIERAIIQQWQLKVTVDGGKVFLVHPHSLLTDKLANGWYLACFNRAEGQPLSQRKCASLRVSNMVSVELLQQKASFTAAQRREVERKIREVGVQFLVEEPCLIRVKMSKEGKKKYAGMRTMRPPCSKRDGDEWEFYCSQRQALWYFSRMARDCEILEPKQLRRDMICYLKKSLENYR